ncbi:MAG: deoxyribonuclease IV [Syntrophomonadaceae bacterium]|nr:deoxyribonuclease IV [Syntrophomonadaceae bacterium]
MGAHLSIGKGLKATADEAVAKGLESIQIFLRNPRGRGARNLAAEEIDYFISTLKANQIGPVAVHIPYICNPAAAKPDVYEFALQVVSEDLARCSLIDADFLVLHPGSYTTASTADGIDKVSQLLNQVLEKHDGRTQILLETMAGQGTEIGRSFEELKQVLNRVEHKDKMGICYDTCHTYAAGYDCTTAAGIEGIVKQMEDSFGKDKVYLVHANDSMKELGAARDRHSHIGKGFIGIEGFKAIMDSPFFSQFPFILETPLEGLDEDIEILKQLRKK